MTNTKNQAIIHFNDGNKLYKLQFYKEALEQYKKALDNDVTFYDAHFCLAKTYIRLKQYDQGIAHFQKYIHLIPTAKQGTYLFALVKILQEENQNKKALGLANSVDLSLSNQQVFDYTTLLLKNNEINDAMHQILKIDSESIAAKMYKLLLENDTIPKDIIDTFQKDNIIPRLYTIKRKLKILKTINIEKEEYANLINESLNLIESIKKDKNSNYLLDIQNLEKKISEIQNLALENGLVALKHKKIDIANNIINRLKDTNYKNDAFTKFEKDIRKLEKKKSRKQIKILLIAILSIIAIAVTYHYTHAWYKKSKAYKNALNFDNIRTYTNYMEQYGFDKKIDSLREEKFYSEAIKTNKSSLINKFIHLYPNNKMLRKVTINTDNTKNNESPNIQVYGIGNNDNTINANQKNTFLAPKGCKLHYLISNTGKIPIDKYFTVTKDITINESLSDTETLILDEKFNENKWKTFNETKETYWGSKKNKGVKIVDGNLELYHEYDDDKFVLTTRTYNKINKKTDFRIVADMKENYNGNGTFLLFGATTRAFNYIGFTSYGSLLFGYNNWDDDNEKWINESDGWEKSSSISQSNTVINTIAINTIQITKKNKLISYEINNSYVGEMRLKKWYGNRIGFGINSNTKATILSLKIYKINKAKKTNFIKDKIYYCWVKELNVRDASDKGNIITTIKLCEPVKYLGEVGEKKVNATFNEIYKPDYYYKVELIDGKIGWVHGGALCNVNTSENISLSDFKKD